MNYQKILGRVMSDERYRKNVAFEYPSSISGHPERKVKYHIGDLEANLECLKERLPKEEYYWKLKFLIHVHDLFKAEEKDRGVPAEHPGSHESLARAFASEFTNETDLLNIIQYHDENFTLWKQFKKTGEYDKQRLQHLLKIIQDWDLFLVFTIIDGNTKGKDIEKLSWFINEVRQHKQTFVDDSWVTL